MGHGSKHMVIWKARSGLYAGCDNSSIPPNSWILSWLFVKYGVSHCPAARELYFRYRFFNNDFGILTGTELLCRGFRVAIRPIFITCDNSLDNSIIHEIIDKRTTDIYSALSLLWCQFMRYGSTASVWFSKGFNLAMYGTFLCTKFFWQHTSTFLRIFFQNSAYILNIP